ncbi:unnamed protein product, partial [Dovyalis caffra]
DGGVRLVGGGVQPGVSSCLGIYSFVLARHLLVLVSRPAARSSLNFCSPLALSLSSGARRSSLAPVSPSFVMRSHPLSSFVDRRALPAHSLSARFGAVASSVPIVSSS